MKVLKRSDFQYHSNFYEEQSTKFITLSDIEKLKSQPETSDEQKLILLKSSILTTISKLEKKKLPYENLRDMKKIGMEDDSDYLYYRLKSEQYKKIKNNQPLIIPASLTLSNKQDVCEYTGNIVLDIDNDKEAFNKVKDDKYIRCAFVSPGGHGVKIIVQVDIKDGEYDNEELNRYHLFSFNSLANYYECNYGVKVDKSGSNKNRLCLLSNGKDTIINPTSDSYQTWDDFKKGKGGIVFDNNGNATTITTPIKFTSKTNKAKIQMSGKNKKLYETAITYFESLDNADIFSDYGDWVRLSFLVFKNFGATGRDIFQKLSSFSSVYDPQACDKLWSNISKTYDPNRVGSDKWIMKLMMDEGYTPKVTDHLMKSYIWDESDYNTMISELGYELILDELTTNYFIKKDNEMEVLDDQSLNQLITDLRLNYNKKLKKDVLLTYIFSKDNMVKKNFIEDKFNEIETTDSTDFDNFFNHIKTEEPKDLMKRMIKRWCLGVIKNIDKREKYFDEILVLKGGQGMGKTTLIINYFTQPFEKWTTTSFQWDTKNPNQMKMLSENLFVYDMENISLTKGNTSIIKTITSTPTIDYRRPYDKFLMKIPRISSFIMDTNEEHVYNDNTGGRRYLILNIESMNIYDKDGGELKKIDYNKFWGYIYHLYKSGTRPGDINIDDLETYRDTSRLKSDMENIIDDLYQDDNTNQMTLLQIIKELKIEYERIGYKFPDSAFNNTNVGRALSKFKSKKVRNGKEIRKVYFISKKTPNKPHDDILTELQTPLFDDVSIGKLTEAFKRDPNRYK